MSKVRGTLNHRCTYPSQLVAEVLCVDDEWEEEMEGLLEV